ncbi:MAG: hypothetical protein ABI658_26545 [Acidimicrobiales bacterium]
MTTFVRDLLSSAAARGPGPRACVGLFAFFAATLVGWTGVAIARWGLPQYWPVVQRVGLVVVSIGGSVSWWWVNASVEGRPIVQLSNNHGITTGDLLVAPALLLAALLVMIQAAPLVRRVA